MTPRELEVIRLRALGRTQLDVALRLGISEQTVKNISLHVFQKLDVSGLVEAMNALGWVKLDREEALSLPDLPTAVRWFSDAWYARDYPTRLHLHAVEPDSVLGSPAIAPKFLRYLSASAMDTHTVEETRTCRHPRIDRRIDETWKCPDCEGTNVYTAQRIIYRDPLAAAIENLRRRPAPWPRGLIPASALVVEFAGAGFRIRLLAERIEMAPDVCAEFVLMALRQLQSRYLDAPPARVGWTAKSDAQRAAEDDPAA